MKRLALKILEAAGYTVLRKNHPVAQFHGGAYLRHNARRLEHLASLGLEVRGLSVLEVGAGIGDHTQYYLDREATVVPTDARPENVEVLQTLFPNLGAQVLDMEAPQPVSGAPFDLVHCYGLLYHLKNPAVAVDYMAKATKKWLFLETCVSFGEGESENQVSETQASPTQAFSGTGSRPTRSWVYKTLRNYFAHVYLPKTQPNHEEFPLDWSKKAPDSPALSRSVFIASYEPIANDLLVEELLMSQVRHT